MPGPEQGLGGRDSCSCPQGTGRPTVTGEGQVQLALSRCFTTKTDPSPALTYPATSCGPCLSCLHQQRPATHGRPLFSDHGPPSHVCPLEKDVSDLDCPHLRSSEQPQQAVLTAPTPSGSGGCMKRDWLWSPAAGRVPRWPALISSPRPGSSGCQLCEACTAQGCGTQTWVEEAAPGPRSSSCRSHIRPTRHGSPARGALVLRGVPGNAGC